MIDFMLDNIEYPLKIIGMSEEQMISLKGHMHHDLIPKSIKLISNCDFYKIKEFKPNEINETAAALNSFDLSVGIESDISIILIGLRDMFDKAKKNGLKIYGVGN